MDRRTMLALSGLAAAGLTAGGAAPAATPTSRIQFVVSDRRLPESLFFAEVLEGRGARRLEATEGLTRLWQDVLLPHWRTSEGATVGLTPVAMWHVLAEQARGEGRRSQLVGRHQVDASGNGVHRIAVPARLAADAGALTQAPGAWVAGTAHLVSRCSQAHGPEAVGPACGTLSAAEGSFPALVSWRIY